MTNDAFLYYNFGDWKNYGLAVPNFGNDTHTQNGVILNLTHVIGRNIQRVMWHKDARLRRPPTINTIQLIHKMCLRAIGILEGRAVPSGKLNLEPNHAMPAPEVFSVYPTPYFEVPNSWLKEYCGLALIALTEAMQHTENAQPLEISEDFFRDVGQYIRRIYRMMAIELLQIPKDEVDSPNFQISQEQFQTYNPTLWFSRTEMIDTVPDLENWPTEDDLKVLTDGIVVTSLPKLGRYPAGSPPVAGSGGASTNPDGSVVISKVTWPDDPGI